MPMGHQSAIILIGMANIDQVTGIVMFSRELLKVNRKASVQRMTLAMDKPGLGKKDRQQAKEQEMVWHFVSNMGLICR